MWFGLSGSVLEAAYRNACRLQDIDLAVKSRFNYDDNFA